MPGWLAALLTFGYLLGMAAGYWLRGTQPQDHRPRRVPIMVRGRKEEADL